MEGNLQLNETTEPSSDNQTNRLMDFTKDFVPFMDENGEVFLEFSIDGKMQVWSVNDQFVSESLQSKYFDYFKTLPELKNVEKVIRMLTFKAKRAGERLKVFHRVASTGSEWFLDLANNAFEAVSISEGGWNIVKNIPVKFVKNKNTLPLPFPVRGGDIKILKEFLNLHNDDDFILFLAFCLGSMKDAREYPILIIQGGQGSSKSTTARILKELIDPGRPVLRSFSRREEDIFIAAKNSHLVCYDNLSGISNAASDSLCKIATGCGMATRKLYTDTDESCIELSRPIVINGIDELAARADLADRSIVLHLPKISEEKRRSGPAIWESFEIRKSEILGALLDALAYGHKRRKSLVLKKSPRMAEFALTACSSLEFFGYSVEKTLSVLFANRAEIAMEAVEANSVGRAIKSFMATRTLWRGNATKLLTLLNRDIPDDERRSLYWPKVAPTLGKEINRLAPSLKLEGIDVINYRDGKTRELILQRDSCNPNILSHPSLLSLNPFGPVKVIEMTAMTGVTDENGSGDI